MTHRAQHNLILDCNAPILCKMADSSSLMRLENRRECPDCGLFSTLPSRQPGLMADCPRCGYVLWRMRRVQNIFPLACALAGLVFYLVTITAPFIEITSFGQFSMAWLETGPLRLSANGWRLVGALVFIVTLIIPGLKLGIITVTLLGLELKLSKPLLGALFRWYIPLSPWAMVDVYLLGFLVAYTRLAGMFSVHLDMALYGLICMMLSMAAVDGSLDHEMIWRALDESPETPPPDPARTVSCHVCSLSNDGMDKTTCRRCHVRLYARKPASISRCWAFTIAAACLYIPANLYPFMTLTSFGQTASYTIMGGIAELAQAGLWPLALLVFFASITIPLLKLFGLGIMLASTQRGSRKFLRARTTTYRVIEFIGRWSMIDVFMVSILVALVHFGQFANVNANTGMVCFAAVVILTIFAVDVFDPRLMWDQDKELTE